MNRSELQSLIYKHVGRTDDLENLTDLAEDIARIAADEERDACAELCEAHYREPTIIRATHIDEDPLRSAALDCAELIRSRAQPALTSPPSEQQSRRERVAAKLATWMPIAKLLPKDGTRVLLGVEADPIKGFPGSVWPEIYIAGSHTEDEPKFLHAFDLKTFKGRATHWSLVPRRPGDNPTITTDDISDIKLRQK